MASKWFRFVGKVKWCNPYVPDVNFGAVRWKTQFLPSEEVIKEIKASGLNKEIKADKDGDMSLQLSRDAVKKIKGDDVFFTPPSIYDKDGKALVEYYNRETNKKVSQFTKAEKPLIEQRGKQVLIGNGSEVEVTVVIYDAGRLKGSRWESIKILDLIEYKREDRVSELADAEGVPFDLDPLVEVVERPVATGTKGW